jgi:hypothetical protein
MPFLRIVNNFQRPPLLFQDVDHLRGFFPRHADPCTTNRGVSYVAARDMGIHWTPLLKPKRRFPLSGFASIGPAASALIGQLQMGGYSRDCRVEGRPE